MEDIFEKKGGGYFFEKVKSCCRDPFVFMVGALTKHARHEKSQSAASFQLVIELYKLLLQAELCSH